MPLDKIVTESVETDLKYDDVQIEIFQPTASTVAIDMDLSYAWGIRGIECVTNTGTCDIQITIGGTPVTFAIDGTTVGVSSTIKNRDSSANFTGAAGDAVLLVISNLSGTPTQLRIKVFGERL